MASAVDRENLGRELKRYHDGGLGGVHVIPIYGAKGAEDRSIPYLSPKWMQMLAFTIEEGRRLGLGVDMTTGTGWCFGGPNVTTALGGQKLVLKRGPLPGKNSRGEHTARLPADVDRKQVTIQAIVAKGPGGEQVEITDRLQPDGTINWHPPTADWTFFVLGHQATGTKVKRAAPGGAGLMINPFDAEAMREYLERFSAAFDTPGAVRPRAMYHDSFEYFGANWSPDLPSVFAQRRGYRIETELAALAGEGGPERAARVQCDVRETLSDMVIEHVFPQWAAWCRKRGILTRNQAHGSPVNWLDFYNVADIPETEMFGHGGPDPLESRFDEHLGKADRDPLISKFASSAAHVAGKPLVSAETGTWLAEHFCETFEELKCEIDLLLLAGVNHIVYHGCIYSPDDVAWPGWLFYASTQMNPRNPLWREAPALNQYAARCQAILREGLPECDVLLYWPVHDAWSGGVEGMSVHNKLALRGPLGDAARALWHRGYAFDYVSDRLLVPMQAVDGAIRGPGGASWQVVVVPPCRHMPHTTLAKLVEIAERGGTVIFQDRLPEDVPGLGDLEKRRASFRSLAQKIFPSADHSPDRNESASGTVRNRKCGSGRVLVGPLYESLAAAGVTRETMTDRDGLKFVRRKHRQGRHYFIVNHSVMPVDGWLELATPARSVAVLDPMTGRSGVARTRPAADGRLECALRLEPGHSAILRTFVEGQIEGPEWKLLRPKHAILTVTGPWQIEFLGGGPVLPKPYKTTELKSWTNSGDPASEAFAGTARYRCEFDWPAASATTAEGDLLLDLGDVRHLSRVRLNDVDLGVTLMRPHRLAIAPGLVKPKSNEITIEVTNLAANRIRDLDRRKVAWRVFHEINLVNIDYRPFDASDWPLSDSGLLGPVQFFRAGLRSD